MFTSIAKRAAAFGLFALLLFPVSNASASRLFDVDGRLGLRFHGQNAASANFFLVTGFGADAANDFEYSFELRNDGTATVSGILNSTAITDFAGNRISDAEVTGHFELNYSGLTLGTDPISGNPVIAVGRQPTATGAGSITYSSDFLGGDVTLNIDLTDKFAFVPPRPNDAFYGDFALAPLNLIAAVLPGAPDVISFKNWVMADGFVNIFPGTYRVEGDFHGTITEVPEPASAALLGLAMVGGALRRKKQAA